MKTLPKSALGLDTVDLGVAAVIVGTRAREDHGTKLAAVLPDLLEWAWEEGYQASVSAIASGDIAFNPYRAAQAAHGDTPGHAGPPERQQ